MPDEINLDVHSIADKLSSVFLACEACIDAIQTILNQMSTPVTQAEQLLPLMKAVFGYSAFQSNRKKQLTLV